MDGGKHTHREKDYEDTKPNAGRARPYCYTHLHTHNVDVREALGRKVGKGVHMQCPGRRNLGRGADACRFDWALGVFVPPTTQAQDSRTKAPTQRRLCLSPNPNPGKRDCRERTG